ncbi:3'-5' DNA helicase, variant 2 [Basidiobolus ranarum]
MSHNPPTSRNRTIPKPTNNKKKSTNTTTSTGNQKTLWNMFAMEKENSPTSIKASKKPLKMSGGSNSIIKYTPDSSLDPSNCDPDTINTWVYPMNYPLREYQFNIVSKALFQNTLVSLPTGLGKTFIAAVVMYNHYRWFPKSKIVFMAPTRPLVAQQIEACHNICGISQEDTVEITGAISPENRKVAWLKKRIFFLTPHVLQNDLIRGTCPAQDIVCLVVDEAHRARGEQANCVVIRELSAKNPLFRVLALSATPGTDTATVQDVVNNLMISHIELRSEESLDIQKYTHGRKIDVIVVPLTSKINEICKQFCSCMEVYTSRLCRMQAIWEKDPSKVSKYMLILARNKFRSGSAAAPPDQNAIGEADFGICLALSHAYSLLRQHGIRPFYNALYGIVQEAKDGKKISRARQDLLKNPTFVDLMTRIEKMLNEPTFIGHPKLEKLVSYIVNYFVNHEADNDGLEVHAQRQTRVMIFAEYRESVEEIVKALDTHSPMIRPMSFIGQASKKAKKGFSQKEQLAVLAQFKEGGYNVIVSTSIGEEGLDIGEVDLIICYDSHNSPIRLLQRMGRTGRKRQGRICMLLSEGKEEQMYKQSQNSYKLIQRAIASGAKITLFNGNPKLLPADVSPVCVKETLTIPEYQVKVAKKSRRKTIEQDVHMIKDMDDDIEGQYIRFLSRIESSNVSLSKFAKYQTTLTSTYTVPHSQRTIDFVNIMSGMETLGFINDEEDLYGLQLQEHLNMSDVIPLKTHHLPLKKPRVLKGNSKPAQSKSTKTQSILIEENFPQLMDLEDDADDFMIMQGIEGIFDDGTCAKPSTSHSSSSTALQGYDGGPVNDRYDIKVRGRPNSSTTAPIEIDLEDIEFNEKYPVIPQSPEISYTSTPHAAVTINVSQSDDDIFIDDTIEQEMAALGDPHQLQENLEPMNGQQSVNLPGKKSSSIGHDLSESRKHLDSSTSISLLRSKYQHSPQRLGQSTISEKRHPNIEVSDISDDITLDFHNSSPTEELHLSKLASHQTMRYDSNVRKKSVIQEIPSFPKNVKFGNWREVAKILSSRKSTGGHPTEEVQELNQTEKHRPPTTETTRISNPSTNVPTDALPLKSKSKLDQFRFKKSKS